MVKYNETKIYAIKNTINNKIFIGATTKLLCQIFSNFKHLAKTGSQLKIAQAIKQLGEDVFYIELEEVCNCQSKDEVNKKVNEYIYLNIIVLMTVIIKNEHTIK